MTEQVLDVKGSLRLLRRFWRVVAVFVVAGAAAAATYDVVAVPRFRATSLVLLPAQPSSPTSPAQRSVTTEAKIATSAAVLVPAGHSADPSLSLHSLQAHVTATSAATSVLEITADGHTRQGAEKLANAVAAQLVQFIATSGSSANANVLNALHAENHQLAGQLSNVQKELKTANARLSADRGTRSATRADAALVARLTAEQSSLQLQQNSVKSEINQAGVAQVAANQGTEVIQRADAATPPSKSSLILPVVLGAFVGLLIGSVAVLAWRRNDPRLRTRDALAETLGAPVLASLEVRSRRSTSEWASLFEEYRPSPLEQWSIRRALRELEAGDGALSALTVVAFADDGAAVTQAVHLALTSTTTGNATSFSVMAPDGSVTALRATCTRYEEEGRDPRPGLVVTDPMTARTYDVDLAVTLLVVGPEGPLSAPLGVAGTPALLSVSPGVASAQQLATVAVAVADAGCPLHGIVVANPTSSDHTLGRFSEVGARSALHRQEVSHA